MSHSLLGLFFSRIRGSQEDVASEGLAYILNESQAARAALLRSIRYRIGLSLPDLKFQTQTTGEDLERPDISGYSEDGTEWVILEAKFWSSLTSRQPHDYLARLSGGSCLVFICPEARIRSFFNELENRMASLGGSRDPDKHAFLLPNRIHVALFSWPSVLSMIRSELLLHQEVGLVSDVDQLIGFCQIVESQSFLPIRTEELAPAWPRRILSYYDLLDQVVDELRKQGIADITGLKATPQRTGYSRYFRFDAFGVGVHLQMQCWAEAADSPFWIHVHHAPIDGNWYLTRHLLKASNDAARGRNLVGHKIGKVQFYALDTPVDLTADAAIFNLARQVREFLEEIRDTFPGLEDRTQN